MKLTILSQNVQGINDYGKLHIIQNYFGSYFSKVDIICFQETKLREPKLQGIKRIMWKGADFYGVEAKVAYNHGAHEIGAGSGGICSWLSPKISHLITHVGQDSGGHAQWFRLSNVPGEDVGVLNVYAPHNSQERCFLWEELLTCLPRDCRWVFIGDWNFVEQARDKSNLTPSHISGEEKRLFNTLKEVLQVEDKFPISNRIKYSWDNRRSGSGRVLARLDRIYSYIDNGKEVSCNDYRILGDSSHSDHLPVWRQLTLVEEEKRKSTYVMSNLYLKDPWVQAKV